MVRRADRVITCSRYMRSHVAAVFGVPSRGSTVIPNGIDPRDLEPVVDDLAALRARYAAPGERLVLLVGRLVYEKGFHLALDALAPVIKRLGDVRFVVAGTGHGRDRAQAPGAAPRPRPCTARSSAGSATTCCTRSTGSPISASSPRSMSRSGSWRSRRWRRAACASSPTPAACARSCPGDGTRRAALPLARLGRARRRPRAGADRRRTRARRLIAEAREHVLDFDWAEVARRTARRTSGRAREGRSESDYGRPSRVALESSSSSSSIRSDTLRDRVLARPR